MVKRMSKRKELLKNTIIIGIGQICTKFINFILLPIYTAILTTSEYGIVDLLNTYVSLLIPLLFFQMDQAIFRFLIDVRHKQEDQKKIISTSIIIILIQTIIYIAIFTIISQFIRNNFKYYLFANIIITNLSGIFLQISRGLGDNKTYSIASIITAVTILVLNVIFLYPLKLGANGVLLATFISNVICVIFIFFKKRLYKYITLREYDKSTLKNIWKYSIPLVPNQLSWWIINVSDRTIISAVLGVAVNGIYSAANKFSSICVAIYSIFNLSWTEQASLSVKDKERDTYYSKIFNETAIVFSGACTLLISIMPFIFSFFIVGKDYASAYYQIPILLIATLFNIMVSMLGSIYIAFKKSKEIAKTSIYSAIINIGITLLLIKHIGLYAASIATLISYLAMTIYRYIDVKKYAKIEIELRTIIFIIISILLSTTTYYIRNNFISALNLIVITILNYFANKDVIKEISTLILNKVKSAKKETPSDLVNTNKGDIMPKHKVKERIKKDKKKFNKLNILSIIDIVFLIILLILIFNVNVLPTKYLVLIIAILLVINILGIVLVNLKKKVVKIIGVIILILSILLSGVGSYYLFYTNNFLNESFNSTKKTVNTYYIVTSSDNKYSKKSDIKNKVYYYKNSANIKNVLKVVKDDLKVKTSSYDDVTSMIQDVVNKKIDFMIIDKSSYDIILNLDSNISKKELKVVYKFNIEKYEKQKENVKDAFNILISGKDFAGLNDYNAIVTVNSITHEILLTSIPRDYYMEIAGQNGKKDSLSHLFIYDEATLEKTLENFFDIDIDYIINIKTEGLVRLVDAVDGITYCSDQSFTTTHALILNDYNDSGKQKLYVKKGCQELNGIETLTVARERNAFVGRDRMRQKNAQKIIIAIFNKMKSANLFAKYNDILDALGDSYSTTIPKKVVTDIAKDTIDGANWKFITQSVDGSDKWDADIAILNGKGYAMIPNKQDVVNATNKINEVLNKK